MEMEVDMKLFSTTSTFRSTLTQIFAVRDCNQKITCCQSFEFFHDATYICLDRVNLRAEEFKCLATAVDRAHLEPPNESVGNGAVSTTDIKDRFDIPRNAT